MTRRATAAEIAAARTRADLCKLANKHGYAPGWVTHVIAARSLANRPIRKDGKQK